MKRGLAALACGLWLGTSAAHDLIDAEAAQRYLDQIGQQQRAAASRASATWRSGANYRIGVALDEIRDLLNRDLEAHGEVQGLPSNYLVAELARRGVPLAYSETQQRFLANAQYFREALRLAPGARHAPDARFRLIQGEFYDSFNTDPLSARVPASELGEQIRRAERFLADAPVEPQKEEASFILAVLYVRAARGAEAPPQRRRLEQKARAAIAEFEARYPQSLRAAALPVLREALPGA